MVPLGAQPDSPQGKTSDDVGAVQTRVAALPRPVWKPAKLREARGSQISSAEDVLGLRAACLVKSPAARSDPAKPSAGPAATQAPAKEA